MLHVVESKMKKILKNLGLVLGLIFFTLVLISSILIYETKQQKKMVKKFAYETISKAIQAGNCCDNQTLPEGSSLEFDRPVDTDLFELTWDVWFKLKPKGSISIRIGAPKGVPFLPLFNSKEDLIIGEIEYHSDAD